MTYSTYNILKYMLSDYVVSKASGQEKAIIC